MIKSSEDIYGNKDETINTSKASSKKSRTSVSVSATPIKVRQIHQPRPISRLESAEVRRRSYEMKIYNLERKANYQLHEYEKQTNHFDSKEDLSMRIKKQHNFAESYANLALAKKILFQPEKWRLVNAKAKFLPLINPKEAEDAAKERAKREMFEKKKRVNDFYTFRQVNIAEEIKKIPSKNHKIYIKKAPYSKDDQMIFNRHTHHSNKKYIIAHKAHKNRITPILLEQI